MYESNKNVKKCFTVPRSADAGHARLKIYSMWRLLYEPLQQYAKEGKVKIVWNTEVIGVSVNPDPTTVGIILQVSFSDVCL